MSQNPVTFPYLSRFPALGAFGMAPLLSIEFEANGLQTRLHAIPDSGAMMNVLPHTVGVYLGFDWAQQTAPVTIGGALSSVEARLVDISVTVPGFAPIRMPFAWLVADAAPLLLGQVTFFDEFDVCFLRSRLVFEVRLRQP
jgi:hypothetical protein